ncbi:MAG TPA: hypothetical protein VM534_08210 [Thermoanaerobaculia bacterium]|nr:hypothetical protein [Thermoanaerobaculia bacterium]
MPSRAGWKPALKAFGGFIAGLALWWGIGPTYNGVIARAAEPLIHFGEADNATRLRTEERLIIVDRIDFPRRSSRPTIPFDDRSFNIILLIALFAGSPQTFSTRNVTRFLLASLILFLTHVAALVVSVQSIYAIKLGAWSAAHYGPFARNFWTGLEHFYRVVGMYGIAFGIWWPLRDEAGAVRRAPRPRKRR